MRVLLDTGIFIHSDFAEAAIKETALRWGNVDQVLPLHGIVRKPPDKDRDLQRQKEALFTVGRLIREGRIEAYDYNEIWFEGIRGRAGIRVCNALQDCKIHRCQAPLERSKFRRTLNFAEMICKGGKKDRKAGAELGGASQNAFLQWLCSLTNRDIDLLTENAARIGLTEFEVGSLRDIDWFKFFCQRWGSAENYPDVFHLWTAERNRLDALLTLERGLPNVVSSIKKEKVRRIEVKTEVLRPVGLLKKFRIDKPDPVPLDANRFYYLHEVT